ncbi:SusD/RagB family nutrient-binding outer membrane lipoprotein [Pedobacter sp. PLR]|uniref:SusD/RagB family nutrient-binding outer membrane lipoprotein n=1 Tax=Pedobacter sp. PLR TaxID=2994465 RepID=UPI002247B826|nr:SusD/RagB family nutrient-binding outer membrane lipoprotein [Pedobacter sp. PLR]MCX2451078.1 SusD/RagB family nutrient-binding outer membrane lipoprotein [Pedobacter sp. PLR]
MKNIKRNTKYLSLLFVAMILGVSCKKESFVKANLDPETLYTINPEDQFLKASTSVPNDFEYFADVYRATNLWMQYTTLSTGNGLNFNNVGAQFNTRYGNFYSNVGASLVDGMKLIDAMPESEKASRTQMRAIMQVLLSYYAFYTSDINGSIPYSEAFQARYQGTLTPKYDTQSEIFSLVDTQLKSSVAALKAPAAGQIGLGGNDPMFNGDPLMWAKAANALRLKVALRLIKVDPAKLKSIATEVIADNTQMSGVADSWMMKVGPSYADAGSNWNPSSFVAGKPVLDFMAAKNDPRLKIYYRPNKAGNYVGSFPSPDEAKLPQNAPLYTSIDNLSQLQHRLFTPNFDEGDGFGAGKGVGFFPLITYAEYCFMRADLSARGITTDVAEDWYKKGVYASVEFYSQRAIAAQVTGFEAVKTADIDSYYAAPGVQFDASKAQEQIAVQAYLDFFRQPLEAWAWWKRTGFPNTTSVLAWSPLTANGAELKLIRRAGITILPSSNLNFGHQQSALAEMATNPDFGSGPNDPFGRVWWDKK